MSIFFTNDNDIFVYAMEKVIAYARDNQHIFVMQWVWWLVSIIRPRQGLVVIDINNLDKHSTLILQDSAVSNVQLEQVTSRPSNRKVSVSPRYLDDDPRKEQILDQVKPFVKESEWAWNQWQCNTGTPLPQRSSQLKKAGKLKQLQDDRWTAEIAQQHSLLQTRNIVVQKL
jgi:hypothetical protein